MPIINKTQIVITTGAIIINWHDYSVYDTLSCVRQELTEFETKTDWKTKRTTRVVKAEYFIDDFEYKEIRFHSEYINVVMSALRGHPRFSEFNIITKDAQYGAYAKINTNGVEPRGRQEEYIEFIANRDKHIRILPAFMGVGKTGCALFSWTRLKTKVALVLAPALADNWKKAAGKFTDLDADNPAEVLYVAGDVLIDYMHNLKAGYNPWKLVIFSLNTLQIFINSYREKEYPMTPDELFMYGEFGIKCVDEAHRCMHFHMLLDMYSNLATHQFLTATLMKEDKFLSDLENTIFHETNRCEVDPPTNHVTLKAYAYQYAKTPPPHIGAMGYQHTKLETQLFKRKGLRKNYLLLLGRILYQDYVASRSEDDKALVYFATVNMVKAFADFLKKKLPDLKIVTYLAGDGESKFEYADIIVSTTKKAGTGTDIPDLTYVLQTIPISSKGENYQNVGRLRYIENTTTTFSYIYSPNISKHLEYHRKRQKDLKPLICDAINITLNYEV